MGPLAQDEAWRATAPPRRAARRRAVSNLLRTGHRAPPVARTLGDLGSGDDAWLVRLAAGLPGGIGNTRGECGGVTGPLLVLGLRAGGRRAQGLPVIVGQGQALCGRFEACHGSLGCRDVLGYRRLSLPRIAAVGRVPALPAAGEIEASRALLAPLLALRAPGGDALRLDRRAGGRAGRATQRPLRPCSPHHPRRKP